MKKPAMEQLEQMAERYRRNPVDPADLRALLSRVPPAWELIERSPDGGAFVRGTVQVIISLAMEADGRWWVHVSACGRTGEQRFYLPTWEELKRVKHNFLGDGWAYQVLPPAPDYVNIHPCVLHLFAPLDGKPALPDFTDGKGSL